MADAALVVQEKIDFEIAVQMDRIAEQELLLPEAQGEYDAAWDEWLVDAKAHPDDDPPAEIENRVDGASRRIHGIYANISTAKANIKRLQNPAELQRRMQTTERLIALRERSNMSEDGKTKKPTAKDQGVPSEYLNPDTGNFRIGMDARLKSDLVNSALGIESAEALHTFSEKEALKLLETRGWMRFLDRKKEIIAAKEEKAAAAAQAKEERARERAAEKEAKAAAKAEAAEKKASSTSKKSPGTSKSDQDRAQREAKAAAASK